MWPRSTPNVTPRSASTRLRVNGVRYVFVSSRTSMARSATLPENTAKPGQPYPDGTLNLRPPRSIRTVYDRARCDGVVDRLCPRQGAGRPRSRPGHPGRCDGAVIFHVLDLAYAIGRGDRPVR